MAIPIKQIPTLTGKKAKSFREMADRVYNEKKATIDFSKQARIAEEILMNAKI